MGIQGATEKDCKLGFDFQPTVPRKKFRKAAKTKAEVPKKEKKENNGNGKKSGNGNNYQFFKTPLYDSSDDSETDTSGESESESSDDDEEGRFNTQRAEKPAITARVDTISSAAMPFVASSMLRSVGLGPKKGTVVSSALNQSMARLGVRVVAPVVFAVENITPWSTSTKTRWQIPRRKNLKRIRQAAKKE